MEEPQETAARQAPMRRNERLEALLAELNRVLPAAAAQLDVDSREVLPKVFIVGPLRGGTTR
jgi:hypothetical protein